MLHSLRLQHKGKRLLLCASTIYGTMARVPQGEEDFIFLYIVSDINPDCQTASIEYEGKYVVEGGREFKIYPPYTTSDYVIENYRLTSLKADNDLYNRYLGIINKEANDLKEKELKRQSELKMSALTDVSDIDRKLNEEKMAIYDVLLMEFESTGPRREHVVTGGKEHVGALTEKQDWSEHFVIHTLDSFRKSNQNQLILLSTEHKQSGFKFVWHIPPGRKIFDKSTLWKVARKLRDRGAPGAACLAHILKLDRKDTPVAADSKHTREEDMEKRVMGVMAVVATRVPLSIFSSVYMKKYLGLLDPKHKPPHNLEVNRIIEVMIDCAFSEFVKICTEQRSSVSNGFVSLSTDFVTDSVRRESYGCIIADLVAPKYEMLDGRELFMSRETASKINDELLHVSLY